VTRLKTAALAAVAAMTLSGFGTTAAKADFWFGGPGFEIGFGAGPYYGDYAWGGGPYYPAAWNSGYSVGWGGYWDEPAVAYEYAPRVTYSSYAYRPRYRSYGYRSAGYRSFAYVPRHRCRTVIVHRPGWTKRVRRCH
jgi:hypothetical protein